MVVADGPVGHTHFGTLPLVDVRVSPRPELPVLWRGAPRPRHRSHGLLS